MTKPKHPILSGVIGDPIAQSLSPAINHYWRTKAGIKGVYLPMRVTGNQDDFNFTLEGLRKAGFQGVNVTLPHKHHALTYAGQSTSIATKVGAANMLSLDGKTSLADNSDVTGFYSSLPIEKKGTLSTALVLGAGGASGAICHALAQYGLKKIAISNRTQSKADALSDHMNAMCTEDCYFESLAWNLKAGLAADLAVNTTSLGMEGMSALDYQLDSNQKPQIVADIVYKPVSTPLLAQARSYGLTAIDGLSMLMHQAVPGFEQWFGSCPGVDETLRERLLDILGGAVQSGMKVIGLTGSIGMGKSTVASMFKALGCPVWDADQAVHRLYSPGGAGVRALSEDFPDAIDNNMVVRDKLVPLVLNDPEKMKLLEAIIHPLVAVDRDLFLQLLNGLPQSEQPKICILDIPLLFENDLDKLVDTTIVVSAPGHVQRARVLERAGMSEAKFRAILSQQMPDEDKRERADFIVSTDQSLTQTKEDVEKLFAQLCA